MLETLEQIEWETLPTHDRNGSAIPQALRDIISKDETTRRSAEGILYCSLVNQGNLYEAAYYAIPFLHEILRTPGQNGRFIVYDLLFEIVYKYASPSAERIVVVNGRERSLRDVCRERVINERLLYYLDLENPDNLIRFGVFELLLLFEEVYGEIHAEIGEFIKESNRRLREQGVFRQYFEPLMLMQALELVVSPTG